MSRTAKAPPLIEADPRILFPHTDAPLACRTNPDWFAHEHGQKSKDDLARIERAKTACSGCPIAAGCLKWALANRELTPTGIWAAFPERIPAGSDTIDRLRSGDREAFAVLYVRYRPLVYDYLVHRTRDRDLSADLTSETFARALARIESFTWTGRDIGAWLVTIARNLVTDHFRSARTRLERPVGEIFDGEWTAGDSAEEVVDHLSHAALAAAVRRVLGDLTPSQEQCLTLRFWQEMPYLEIARVMGRSEGAAKLLKERALKKLRTPAVRAALAAHIAA
ncbi:sigma-70 family RNA polymerase sigma factor [Streptomyces sp. NBC_01764]|uniref:sigma-70 family RNA polymerase sigma factor n=1 Tax=Streptomyces sp. NBC_01764 TaxID=2975935 RepID=UPI0022543D16|nr:sigma-70 family RNA polymerase sigma factor [Streptomyces sp. NBC_01764]MCX4404446.1 sigma-70 family RNA polymerase sigma factor [Streptomyces sp. NBC_01764]